MEAADKNYDHNKTESHTKWPINCIKSSILRCWHAQSSLLIADSQGSTIVKKDKANNYKQTNRH